MKKVSLVMLLVFAGSVMIYSSAVSQENTADKSSAVTQENTADKPAEAKEILTKEDAAINTSEKVYENEAVAALKGQPKVFSDGYHTYVNDRVTFQLTDIDNIMKDTVMYKIDDQPEQTYTGPFTISQEGNHVITYYSVDKMGNKENQKIINVIVDTTAPQVAVTIVGAFTKINDIIYVSDKFSYNYSISSKDAMSGVASTAYAFEGQDQKEYIKPFVLNSAVPLKLDIVSEDKVGNITKKYESKVLDESGVALADSIEKLQIVVDKTAPEVQIKADKSFFQKGSQSVAAKDFKYSIIATDAESGAKLIYCRLDSNSDFILYTGELQFSANGPHKIEAIAIDGVGNTSKTAVLNVFVDTIPANTDINLVTE